MCQIFVFVVVVADVVVVFCPLNKLVIINWNPANSFYLQNPLQPSSLLNNPLSSGPRRP